MEYDEKSCGGILYRFANTKKCLKVLLIKHVCGGHWSFPKGHMLPYECEIQTAMREIREETGIKDVKFDITKRYTVVYSPHPQCLKQVVYFLGQPTNKKVKRQLEEISEIYWATIDEAYQLLTFANDRSLLDQVRKDICILNDRKAGEYIV